MQCRKMRWCRCRSRCVHFKLYAAFKLALFTVLPYCNFSGYIDIVIAVARLMRVRLPKLRSSVLSFLIIDFWNVAYHALHMLKTYVYNLCWWR